jgi:uncharacterized protein (TIGR02145 family)
MVHFQANNGGSVSQSQLMTDIDGKAGVVWTLGPTDSVQTVTCTAFQADSITPLQGSPLTFTAQANLTGCPGLPSFSYGGQTYNTVLIGSQCWMKENLNIGTMVTDIGQQTYPNTQCSNNGIIEKYCYGNNVANCNEHGGLYDWDEMMQYTPVPGVQGICPSGWHIPTMVEIQTLVNYLDPTVNWGMSGMSGTDGGGKLKETGTTHWNPPNTGATNISGFTFLGVGNRDYRGGFFSSGLDGYIWSSNQTSYSIAADLLLHHNFAGINNDVSGKTNGFPVRCIKNP